MAVVAYAGGKLLEGWEVAMGEDWDVLPLGSSWKRQDSESLGC